MITIPQTILLANMGFNSLQRSVWPERRGSTAWVQAVSTMLSFTRRLPSTQRALSPPLLLSRVAPRVDSYPP